MAAASALSTTVVHSLLSSLRKVFIALALVSFLVKNTPFPTIVFFNPNRYMEITDSACVPTFSFPFVLDCHQYYELMVAQAKGDPR